MMSLPVSKFLPVQHLAASFDNVTTSYKFYWFLAILGHISQKQERVIPVKHLVAQMIARVWYPTNYFRLSFGKQDRLGQIALELTAQGSLPADAKQHQVIETSLTFLDQGLHDIGTLQAYVPYRFIRPFFALELRGLKDTAVNSRIEFLANQAFEKLENPVLYRFVYAPDPCIELHPDWFAYLQLHLPILTGFCMWNLTRYIQKNNPNVPNISSKLLEPGQRDLRLAREFWRVAMERLDSVECIYSGASLADGQYSLDHFLPWRFVAHDLLWNIIPSPKNVNSSKNDNLPDVQSYFEKFASLQFRAVKAVMQAKKPNLLEDHIMLTKTDSFKGLEGMSYPNFRDILSDSIMPQFQIAENMGFSPNWVYWK